MTTCMKNVNNVQVAEAQPWVLLSICQFQPGFAYKSVLFMKKSVQLLQLLFICDPVTYFLFKVIFKQSCFRLLAIFTVRMKYCSISKQ